jgi:hypothetical protein
MEPDHYDCEKDLWMILDDALANNDFKTAELIANMLFPDEDNHPQSQPRVSYKKKRNSPYKKAKHHHPSICLL